MLVDRQSRIRGYYDTSESRAIPRLIDDIYALARETILMDVHSLPAVNATLNATAAVLLLTGYILIRRRRIQAHKRVMLTAFGVSIAFLICYLVYHSQVGSVHYQKTGPMRMVYFSILITHTLLAATVPVLAIITLRRALRGDFKRHRQIARWTFPIWLYVSVTGVIVYLMLYQVLEREARAQLERARTAGAEGSAGAAGRLAEAGIQQIVARSPTAARGKIIRQVREVENVEPFGEDLQFVAVVPLEQLGQAQVLRVEVVAEVVVGRQRDCREGLAGIRTLLAGVGLVVLIHQPDQIGFAQAAVEQAVAHAGQREAIDTAAGEIDAGNDRLERAAAAVAGNEREPGISREDRPMPLTFRMLCGPCGPQYWNQLSLL